MIPELSKFREKYPQYEDMSDSDLANSLAQKYPDSYGDLPNKLSKISSGEESKKISLKDPETISSGIVGSAVGAGVDAITGMAKSDPTVVPTALSGMIGAQASSLPVEGITPAIVGALSGSTGGMLGAFLSNPRSFAEAGYVGANIAAGEDLVNMFSGKEDQDKPLYAPKTLGGNIVMGGMEAAVGGKSGLGVASDLERLQRVPGAMERLQSIKTTQKAQKAIKEFIPEIKLAKDIEQNKTSGAVNEGINLIKKTNNPRDVVTKFRLEKEKVLSVVDKLVEENNQPVNPEFIKGRLNVLLEREIKNASPSDIKKLQIEANEQFRWLSQQKNLDTKTLNARKRYLYEQTQPLQGKQSQGQTVLKSPKRDLVRDKFAQIYKEAVESTHPDIKKFNSRYDGLKTGLEAVSKMEERVAESGNLLQRLLTQIAGRPSIQSVGAAGVREIPLALKGIGSQTGKIEKLSSQAADLLNKSRQLQQERLLQKFIDKNAENMSNTEYFKNVFTPNDAIALTKKDK